MEQFSQMIETQTILFLYLIVGVICRKLGICSDEFRSKLTDFLLYITLPCMIFESFNMELSLTVLQNTGVILLTAIAVSAISIVLNCFIYRRVPENQRRVMQYGTLCSNSVFTGFPVISSLYGSSGLLLASVFVIPTRILMWTKGIAYFTGKTEKGFSRILKTLCLPAVVAVYLGLLRMILGIPIPKCLNTAIDGIGACTSPFAMILVGTILADSNIRQIIKLNVFFLVAIRQAVIPILCLLLLQAMPLDGLVIGVSTVLAGMPIATTTAILAQRYNCDAQFASSCVFVSTVTSLLTVPLLTLLIP